MRVREGAWRAAVGLSIDQIGGMVHTPENAEYGTDRHLISGEVGLFPGLFCRVLQVFHKAILRATAE